MYARVNCYIDYYTNMYGLNQSCFEQILVALDNGSIELLTLAFNNDDPAKSYHFLERLKTIQEHDDIITGMTLTSDGTKVVTSSYDK